MTLLHTDTAMLIGMVYEDLPFMILLIEGVSVRRGIARWNKRPPTLVLHPYASSCR